MVPSDRPRPSAFAVGTIGNIGEKKSCSAWNFGNTTRLVLSVDVWHPDLNNESLRRLALERERSDSDMGQAMGMQTC